MGVYGTIKRFFRDAAGNKAVLHIGEDGTAAFMEFSTSQRVISTRVDMPIVINRPARIRADGTPPPGWHRADLNSNSIGRVESSIEVNGSRVGRLTGQAGDFRLTLDATALSRDHQRAMQMDWEASIGKAMREVQDGIHMGLQEAANGGSITLREVTRSEFVRGN